MRPETLELLWNAFAKQSNPTTGVQSAVCGVSGFWALPTRELLLVVVAAVVVISVWPNANSSARINPKDHYKNEKRASHKGFYQIDLGSGRVGG